MKGYQVSRYVYHACWEIIKGDIMDMFLEFSSHSLDIARLNYGVITLIPKLKDASKIQQYRPICLLNVSYKIFTKALMLRFEDCMSRIINPCRSAFIKGRTIVDGVMTLHEVRKRDGPVLSWILRRHMIKLTGSFCLNA
jgi:hypothetical protein